MTTGKTIVLTIWTFVCKNMPLLFHTLSRCFIVFLLRRKFCFFFYFQISWLQSLSVVIFGAQENKICLCFPIYLLQSDVTGCHDPNFFLSCFKLAFHSPLSPSSRVSLVPLHFLPIEWYHLHIWDCCYFSQQFDSSLWFIQSGIVNYVLCLDLTSWVTMYRPVILLSQFWTSQLFHVWF